MGAFFSQKLQKLLKPPSYGHFHIIGDHPDPVADAREHAERQIEMLQYRRQARDAGPPFSSFGCRVSGPTQSTVTA
jgi:hypothetical protein